MEKTLQEYLDGPIGLDPTLIELEGFDSVVDELKKDHIYDYGCHYYSEGKDCLFGDYYPEHNRVSFSWKNPYHTFHEREKIIKKIIDLFHKYTQYRIYAVEVYDAFAAHFRFTLEPVTDKNELRRMINEKVQILLPSEARRTASSW